MPRWDPERKKKKKKIKIAFPSSPIHLFVISGFSCDENAPFSIIYLVSPPLTYVYTYMYYARMILCLDFSFILPQSLPNPPPPKWTAPSHLLLLLFHSPSQPQSVSITGPSGGCMIGLEIDVIWRGGTRLASLCKPCCKSKSLFDRKGGN